MCRSCIVRAVIVTTVVKVIVSSHPLAVYDCKEDV